MIEVGQILSLKIRFNNKGDVSSGKHPYLVVNVSENNNSIEIAQLDSLEGKEYKALLKSNKTIRKDNDTVIDKDSYVQLDNRITVENFPGLETSRRQNSKLSEPKLNDVINEYHDYQKNNTIDANKCVHMDKTEILQLNSDMNIKIKNKSKDEIGGS